VTRTILVVDDEPSVRDTIRMVLRGAYRVLTAPDGARALEKVEHEGIDLVLLDYMLPEMNGLAVLKRTRELAPDVDVIMVTANEDVQTAVEAMKAGALDWICKPFDAEKLRHVVAKAFRERGLRQHVDVLKEQVHRSFPTDGLVGQSRAMDEVQQMIRRAASVNSTVLITGETGTGKELCARAIHSLGRRSDGPFVDVACTAIPDTLLESELFGYEKGAFTGAHARKAGKFELAHDGTLFLDEIGDVPAAIQVKLLRVLQTREFTRVGGTHNLKVDVRVVAATNRGLEEMTRAGTFRDDLYYRLCVLPIRLPPLRDRREDIPDLARHFLDRFRRETGGGPEELSDEAMRVLTAHPWPGNVRELQNIIERSVVLNRDRRTLEARDLPTYLLDGRVPDAFDIGTIYGRVTLEEAEQSFEKALILRALAETGGNYSQAARILGTTRRILKYKVDKLGIDQGPTD
jgi:DNA-binding NtrC family response regulator